MDVAEAWKRSRSGRCACLRCFYCERPLDIHQHDHYPVPKRAGGSKVVAACLLCHDLKDRVMLKDWDVEAAIISLQELFCDLPDSLRSLRPEEVFDYYHLSIEEKWGSLTPLARVMYAKLRSIYEDWTASGREVMRMRPPPPELYWRAFSQ